MVKDLFKRSGLYAFFLLIGRGLTLVLYILLARILQPKLFGDAVLFVTLSQFFTFFADFGLNQWYMKQADKEDKVNLFNKIIAARTTTLVITLILALFFLSFTQTFNFLISIVLILSLIPEAFLSIVDGYYLEKKRPLTVTLKSIVRNLIIITGVIIFANRISLEKIVVIYLISTIINVLIIFPWKILSIQLTNLNQVVFQTLKKSSAYALLLFTSYFYARGDHLIIKYLLNSAALGIYSAAYRYLEALSLIPTALTHNLFPLSAKKEGLPLIALKKIILLTTITGLVISLCLYYFADFLIIQLIGIGYQTAIIPLQIFSGVVLLFFLNSPLSTVVQSSSLLKKFLPFGISNTILNLILNIIFVPIYGINAAAWVMLTTEITGFLINFSFIKKIYKKN